MLTRGYCLGPYEIVSVLGTGGMGEVYRATDERLRRDVAIEVLPASYTEDPERLQRFEQRESHEPRACPRRSEGGSGTV